MENIPIRNELLPPILDAQKQKENGNVQENEGSFGNILTSKIEEINKLKLDADDAITKVEFSDSGSIHEAIIAMEKASISFKTMLQVRNKVLEAYQEVMRMQV